MHSQAVTGQCAHLSLCARSSLHPSSLCCAKADLIRLHYILLFKAIKQEAYGIFQYGMSTNTNPGNKHHNFRPHHTFSECLWYHQKGDLMTIKHRLTPLSMWWKSHLKSTDSQSNEAEWARLNGFEYTALGVMQRWACQVECGVLWCMTPGISRPYYLAVVFPDTKINIWVSVVPEALIFYSSTLLHTQEFNDPESLTFIWLTTEAADFSNLFEAEFVVVEIEAIILHY